jgi:hypothetical protein
MKARPSSPSTDAARPSPAGLQADVSDAQEVEPSPSIRWTKRALPAVFLLVVTAFAVRELRSLDIHAVRTVLGSLSLPHWRLFRS